MRSLCNWILDIELKKGFVEKFEDKENSTILEHCRMDSPKDGMFERRALSE